MAQPRLILRLYDLITQGRIQYSLLIRRIHSSRLFYLVKRQSAPGLAGCPPPYPQKVDNLPGFFLEHTPKHSEILAQFLQKDPN